MKKEREVTVERQTDVMLGAISFPCHPKAKIFVYEGAKGPCSARCPFCSRFAKFDLDKMLSIPMQPAQGALRRMGEK